MWAFALTVILAPAKPSIVYVMADDLGYGDVGCFGQTKIPTPHIDRLAQEGMRLTQYYSASPVCAPTRYSLMTGKHQGNAAIRGNKENGGFGPNDPEGQTPFPLSEKTLPEFLKKQGYATALVGKWGIGSPRKDEHPEDHGFDFFYGYLCQRRAHNLYPAYLWKGRQPDLLSNQVFSAHQKIEAPLANEADYWRSYQGSDYAPAKMLDEATKWIRSQPADKPIFLYFASPLPHVALQAPLDWIEKFPRDWDADPYLGKNGYLPNPRPRATYAAMVAYFDHSVGELRRVLADSGRSNCFIFVTSDNGAVDAVGGADRAFFKSNGELRAGKMSLYEGGVRVPAVAWWPGKIAPASVSNQTAICWDVFATIADILGIQPPRTDGMSFKKALLGEPTFPRTLYFEYPEAGGMQAVRIGDWKVIRPTLTKDSSVVELYDLAHDPRELKNLAGEHPEIIAEGLKLFNKMHVSNTKFPLPGVDTFSRTQKK
ncbi:MAG: arylsulfatase [Chthonomonadaceae bacterium]|nr:arylsulfatase [Chthonomonadaceae bacterium]